MRIRFSLGLGCMLSVVAGCAVGQPKAAESMPLRQVVNLMVESVPVSEKTLSIKGIEWDGYGIRRKRSSHLSRSGHIHIRRLGKSEITVWGKDNEITEIDTFYYKPNKRVKTILQQNLGSGVDIQELGKECQFTPWAKREKIYRITLENHKTVYVLSDVNTSLEPFTTPLQTSFYFHKEMPEHWGCK